jgi:hypothetical protein
MYAAADNLGDLMIGATGLSAVVLAARAIREAHAMYLEYGEAQGRVAERESARQQQREQLQAANVQRIGQLHGQAERLQAKLSRLQNFLQSDENLLEALPQPATQDDETWNDYLAQLQQLVQKTEASLPVDEVFNAKTRAALLAEQPNTMQLITVYAQQQARKSKLTAAEAGHYQSLSFHLLARLEQDADASLPTRIEFLARELLQAYDVARAEAVAADLRLAIQQANQQRQQQVADAAEARTLLTQLADAVPVELRITLEAIAAGVRLFDQATRDLANATLANVNAEREREQQEAIGVVLEQSLRDLGYEVSDIDQTLFVSGGMVHFQKPAWHNYHVRMRVNPKDQTVNFNVVRPKDDTTADKRQDYLAEDRWCSEFPTLLKTLAARGVKLNVTRLLQAGEVPVQAVDPATLPVMKQEEAGYRTMAAKQMNFD